MKEKTVSKRNSTVAISATDTERLDRFCRAHDITKKDFITLSLSYFEREGINPISHESPKSEIEKVIKRLDHFFAFFKKQEQEYIRPLVFDFAQTKIRTDKNLKDIIANQFILQNKLEKEGKSLKTTVESETKEQLKSIENSLKGNTNSAKTDSAEQHEELKRAIQVLAQHMDEKNKSGLMKKLFK